MEVPRRWRSERALAGGRPFQASTVADHIPVLLPGLSLLKSLAEFHQALVVGLAATSFSSACTEHEGIRRIASRGKDMGKFSRLIRSVDRLYALFLGYLNQPSPDLGQALSRVIFSGVVPFVAS